MINFSYYELVRVRWHEAAYTFSDGEPDEDLGVTESVGNIIASDDDALTISWSMQEI
jgi:hypothetical protein